jgi:hypothetical protein
MGFSLDIAQQAIGPAPPLEPTPASGVAPRGTAQQNSEQNSADIVGSVATGGTQDGLTLVYDPVDRVIDATNTDKGTVAVAAHEAETDPHPQYGRREGIIPFGLLWHESPEEPMVIPGPRGATGPTGPAGGGGGSSAPAMPMHEDYDPEMIPQRPRAIADHGAAQILHQAGTLALPSYSFALSPGLGTYYDAGNALGFALGATNQPATLAGAATSVSLYLMDRTGSVYGQIVGSTGALQLFHINAGSAIIDIGPRPTDGTSASTIRNFRSTNTTGLTREQWYRGNNTATVDHQLVSDSSGVVAELARNGGRMMVGGGTDDGSRALQVNGGLRVLYTSAEAIQMEGDASGGTILAGYRNGIGSTRTFYVGNAGTDNTTMLQSLDDDIEFLPNNTLNVRLGHTSGLRVVRPTGLGYDTGAGAAVTQLTSKATAVTINAPCGAITMNNAALAANTRVAFVVNNSTVDLRDTIVINQAGSAFSGSYMVWIDYVASGSFLVRIWNYTAGSLSHALVLNFSVIKAVNS